ncbi:hypothetical protein T4E_1185 [Trichinella pseudospiralis]|uniref:Uncharacterized protein n=1 Tax=Trichinella pseudospiralis TaxID=6337 RepID=A0A0V0XED0_TRIPS|nr:hypothetical protein T4E_8232 [Trichinella pseudospiralis]KRX86355.1 hypothetical protein T4E_1185 [Trichinella pseudospiralis]
MDLNWKGMKSIMGFYPKSESRAMCLLTWVMSHLNNRCVRKFQSQNLLVLMDHSVQFLDCDEKKRNLSFCISGYCNWKCANGNPINQMILQGMKYQQLKHVDNV